MKALEISRENGVYPIAYAKRVYAEFGVLVLKNYVPADSQVTLRRLIEAKLTDSRSRGAVVKPPIYPDAEFMLGDVLAVRELQAFDYIFFGAECVQVIKGLLETEELLYWGDSSIQFGEAARGFHKDNVDRSDGTGDDWSGSYGLVRCGFYFQEHAKHSGGLKVRLASHKVANHMAGRMSDIATDYGDVVIWNMRLTHSGNNKRLRFPLRLVLHPRLEQRLPKFALASEPLRRIAAFCSFGRPGSHVDRYIERMNSRDADYSPYFKFARKAAEAGPLVAHYGLSFRQPRQTYGELD
jgi:hypothetical protein